MLKDSKAMPTCFLLAIVSFAAGCAPTAPLEISLALKVPTVPINIGAETKVHVSVLDQRPDKTLGYRARDFRWQGMNKPLMYVAQGPISTSEDIADLIGKSLRDELASLGFETLAVPEPSVPKLEVTIQRLVHEVAGNSADGACCVNVANFNGIFIGKLYKDDSLLYEKSYFHSREHTYNHFRAADSSWFEENFNAALSELLGQLLTDLELLAKLKLQSDKPHKE